MPCPHFSVRDNDCTLTEEQPKDDDELGAAPREEPVNRAWCTGDDKSHRQCPVFQRFVADLFP